MDTTLLGSWTFDSGTPEGWTMVDRTAQPGTFFHVDDFAGLGGGDFGRLVPLEGMRSMWCGLRPGQTHPELCAYATPPGYGNNWDQVFYTLDCLEVTGDVALSYLITWDSEEDYDYTAVDYDECDDRWVALDGGLGVFDGAGSEFHTTVLDSAAHGGQARLRFRFFSDVVWSDQDGVVNTDGAVILDSVTVRDASGVVLPTEDFESESVGATATLSGNWLATGRPGYGNFAALFPGNTVVQDDPCESDITHLWGFFSGSTATYACGGHPGQAAVPYQNLRGQYIHNEIWSPWVPLSGTGEGLELSFDVYRDLPLDNLVFYVWHVREIGADACPGLWKDHDHVYYDSSKQWHHQVETIFEVLDAGSQYVQAALGVRDMCGLWCGVYGTASCHSHAPLFGNVEVRRVDTVGPQWEVSAIDLFQDNFASDGTTTGAVRADCARSLTPDYFTPSSIRPGDSVTVEMFMPGGAIATDPHTGTGPAAYAYVNVRPPGQAGKQGAALTSDPARWPVVDSLSYGGDMWYCIRMDSAFATDPRPDTTFCLDLNDSLFTPGDTVFYVFSATSATPVVETSYYSQFTGVTADMGYAFSNPMEFTCLPTQHGGGTLYVDGCDGTGVQAYFDAAFAFNNFSVDRYDILGGSRYSYNSPASRVTSVTPQLVPAYRRIIWSTGELPSGPFRDGYGWDDPYAMLTEFLEALPAGGGGVYISGNDVAEAWRWQTGTADVLRDTYMNFDFIDGNHADLGYGVSPLVTGESGGIFDHFGTVDTWVAYGGCPVISDFDVIAGGGLSAPAASFGSGHDAVVAQQTLNAQSEYVRFVLSGVSFHEIENVNYFGHSIPAGHILGDIWEYLYSPPVVDAGNARTLRNSLSPNVPNPFNPSTAIEFTVKERAPVTLRVYNVRGQLVKTLVNDTRAPGVAHRVEWDGHNDAGQRVASGVYFYRLVTRGYTKTRKMVLLK